MTDTKSSTAHSAAPAVILHDVFAKKVGRPEWVESLYRLVKFTAGVYTSGGRVAAKVVLAAYNSED